MKNMQLLLAGLPGTGKSTFAVHAPKPFFITTDNNYQYLDIYGAKDEDHIQVHDWVEWLIVVDDLVKGKYDKYETIVVDLVEDLYKWNEEDYCKMNNLQYVGDEDYGKGWRITQDRFFISISRVLSLNKNVILLTHAYTTTGKDRRGIKDITKYWPSNKVPDKVWDSIVGRVRYALHCYEEDEVVDEKIIKHRYISMVPKSGEFGVTRGLDENNTPNEIPLDWTTFANVIGLSSQPEKREIKQEPKVEPKVEVKEEAKPTIADVDLDKAVEKQTAAKAVEPKPEVKEEPKVAADSVMPKEEPKVEVQTEVVKEEPKTEVVNKESDDKNAKLSALMAKLGLKK